ncbi:MAG: LapA family protein [Sphingopyxis sp.]|uniref:LapA family protein n=1 Tax=Sphingopyxis sp. TaxID=1908224 RepID=UPI001A583528|nr:LapA family protein [Sphingopyxis sp.]MBL9070984.1 LapA family protein [Sphingopyxis sp.]
MGILRTIIWVVLAVALAIFSAANWEVVVIKIWPGQEAEAKLPVLVIVSFLLGMLPMWIALRTSRWSLKRRLDSSERQLADMRALANRPVEPVIVPTPVRDVPPTPDDLFSTDKS